MQPKLRFKKFKNDWERCKLADIFTIKYGKDHKSIPDGNIPVLGTGGVMRYINRHIYDKPSVLIGRKGTINKPIFIEEPFWTVDTLFYTEIKQGNMPYFVYSLCINIDWIGLNEATGVPSLNTQSINAVVVFKPSCMDEQTKIANFLSTVDHKIDLLTQKQQAWIKYKQGMMQQLFSGKIRFKDENGEIFPEWGHNLLGNLALVTTGSSNRQDSDAMHGKYVFFDRSQDIRTSNLFLFDAEAVIVGGEGQEFLPKYFIGKFDLHQRAYAIMQFNPDLIIGKYIYYYIHHHQQYFLSVAVGSTVKSLRLPMFQNMEIKAPCLKEQSKMIDCLTTLDKKINALAQQLEQLKKWKQGLLQQMFI